jgi:exopolysaccharide biosynthesis protein
MESNLKLRAVLIQILLFVTIASNAQSGNYENIKWDMEKIAPGLKWVYSHTRIDDSIPQNINILEIKLTRRNLRILYTPDKNIPVSKQAAEANVIAAVNGGFFNIKDGGSTTYVRTQGKITDADTARKWSRNQNMTGSVMITSKGVVSVGKAQSNGWYNKHSEYEDVLVTGPLLILNNEKVKLDSTSLVVTRHPRTAIGLTGKRKVVVITLDGRTDQAWGMSLFELSSLMKDLGCTDAVNLDGGGSTTMWIKGKPFNGVVNMPCDNKKFDHEGERLVSDIFVVK